MDITVRGARRIRSPDVLPQPINVVYTAKKHFNPVWKHMPVTSTLWLLSQEDYQFKASLAYIARLGLCFK